VSRLVALLSGTLFGAGLALSGMTNPQKVQNFLDVAGSWDPSLAFVMGGALAVTAVGYQLSRRRHAPLYAERFPEPPAAGIDRRLTIGAALFGIGWGLVGLCPGPALANLARPSGPTLLFVASMLIGMALFQLRGRMARPRVASAVGLALTLLTASPARPAPDTRTLTLVHLNDLHANLVPHLDLVRASGDDEREARAVLVERGGVARIATLVRQIRAESPRSVLMNVGDTYHGGVEALYTRGNAVVPAVNALGVDVGVPGNWDFAYGAVTTRLRYAAEPGWIARLVNWLFWDDAVLRPDFPNLAANLTLTMPPLARGDALLPGSLMLDVEGVRVGFIGLTSDIVPRMAKPFSWGFAFLEGEEAYKELVDRLATALRRDGAQVVVVMSELGLHRDRRLADVVQPGVDVFFSGHTHEATFAPLESESGALVVESGNDGWLGRMDLTLRGGAVEHWRWQLIPVDASVPEDPEVRALVDRARAPFLADDVDMQLPAPWLELPLDRPIDTVVGHVDTLLHRRDVLHNPFNALLAEVIRREAGTQVSMTPGFRFDAVVPPGGEASGAITLEQLYRFLPVSPSLAVGEVRGADLRAVVEEEVARVFSDDPFEHSGGWLGGFGGIDAELDLSKPAGERVRELRLRDSGRPIRDDETLSVASCVRPFDDAGTMCDHPVFEAIRELRNPETGRAWTPLELMIHAFESGTLPTAPGSSVTESAGVALWPEAAFIQPL
jgi:2',3'-cyclic-nucleotide 2'-phosphodiesterase (5'-nucleotidase family)